MGRTQKNKATEFHFGVMKARLAKLRTEVFKLIYYINSYYVPKHLVVKMVKVLM